MTAAAIKNYLGAKNGSGVYQAIINLMPPHDTYIEAFLGTGAVMCRKGPAARSIGLDKNQRCIDGFDSTGLVAAGYVVPELICTDAINFMAEFDYAAAGKTLIYCDPPYVHSTRTSSARYEHELTDREHLDLLQLLKVVRADVIISGYRNDIYQTELDDEGWWSMDFQAMTRGGVRTETVWCNFEPGKVHYHKYAGKNHTDRQRIQRKAARWAKNFAVLPQPEQQAILAALLAAGE